MVMWWNSFGVDLLVVFSFLIIVVSKKIKRKMFSPDSGYLGGSIRDIRVLEIAV